MWIGCVGRVGSGSHRLNFGLLLLRRPPSPCHHLHLFGAVQLPVHSSDVKISSLVEGTRILPVEYGKLLWRPYWHC